MANFDFTIEFLPGFYTKTDPNIYHYLLTETMNDSGEHLLELIKEEAPVRTGRLRDGHELQIHGDWINITNEAYYWKYVVMRGNDYIDRGLLRFIAENILEEKLMEKMFKNGLI